MGKLFQLLFDLLAKKRWILILFVALLLPVVYWSIQKINLVEDITEVLPASGNIRAVSKMLNESTLSKRIVFNVLPSTESTMDEYELIAIGDQLNDSLKTLQARYSFDISYEQEELMVDELFDFYLNNIPYYLRDEDYLYLDSVLQDSTLIQIFLNNRAQLISPAGIGLRQFYFKDPLHLASRAMTRLKNLQLDENYDLVDGRIISNAPLNLVFFMIPQVDDTKTAINAALFSEIDKVLDHFQMQYPEIEFLYFSGSRVAAGNADQVKTDVYLTVGIAVVMLLLLIGTYLRNPLVLLKLFVPMVLAGLMSVVVLAHFKTNISIIAIGAGSILLGISIDFALHFYIHFRQSNSIHKTLIALTPSILMSAFTTALAFLCLSIIDSTAIADLALFAAISITSSALFTLVFLPHLFKGQQVHKTGRHLIDRLAKIRPEKSRILVWCIILLGLFSIPFASKVQFNEDIMDLNYMSPELMETEKKLNELNSFSQKSLFLISKGKDRAEALSNFESVHAQLDSLKKTGLIGKFVDHSTVLSAPRQRLEKLQKWQNFWRGRQEKTVHDAMNAATIAGFNESATAYLTSMVYGHFDDYHAAEIADFSEQALGHYYTESETGVSLLTLIQVNPENRAELLAQFDNSEFNILTDKQEITAQFVALLISGFEKFVNLSLWVVFLVLWIFYGRIELAVITFLPIVTAWTITLALMYFFDIRFNIFNVMLASFVFGLGIDYCIFITRGLQLKYERGKDELDIYRASIYLSAFTTIIGTGVLIFAKHPAIHSLAFIAIFGISSVLLLSNSLQPYLYNFLVYRKGDLKRAKPITFFVLLNTLFVYVLWGMGSVVMYGVRLLFMLLPLPLKLKKKIFHILVRWFHVLLVHAVFYIPRKHLDMQNFDLKKPAIIIANHQSFVDIFAALHYSSKIMIQTKDWVWNNVFLRPLVRYADCFPISYGYDHNLHLIQERMDDGYSFFIFPEGARSTDFSIKRFHKGAFLMAQELKADILPIVFHGAGRIMPIHETILYNESLHAKYLPRISSDSTEFGLTYRERAKNISKYMRSEFETLRASVEKPKYFKNKLISRYIYKGPVLEWYCKIKLRLEDNYVVFDQHLPKSGLIYDVGCGYGFLSHMLCYTSKDRTVIGIDYDEEKIEVAAAAERDEHRPTFYPADVCSFEYEAAEAFIISDVLHYLPKEKQIELLNTCLNKLKPGGLLMVRDANAAVQKRHLGTRITEIFSTQIFGFNKTENALEFVDEAFFMQVFEKHPVSVRKIDNTKLTSNQFFIVQKDA